MFEPHMRGEGERGPVPGCGQIERQAGLSLRMGFSDEIVPDGPLQLAPRRCNLRVFLAFCLPFPS